MLILWWYKWSANYRVVRNLLSLEIKNAQLHQRSSTVVEKTIHDHERSAFKTSEVFSGLWLLIHRPIRYNIIQLSRNKFHISASMRLLISLILLVGFKVVSGKKTWTTPIHNVTFVPLKSNRHNFRTEFCSRLKSKAQVDRYGWFHHNSKHTSHC